jgi:hypothetical protein
MAEATAQEEGQQRMRRQMIEKEMAEIKKLQQEMTHQQHMKQLHELRLRKKNLSERRDTLVTETANLVREIEEEEKSEQQQKDKKQTVEAEMKALEELRGSDYEKWVETMEAFLGTGTTTPKDKRTERFTDSTVRKLEKKVAEQVAAGATPKTPKNKEAKRQRVDEMQSGDAIPDMSSTE